MVRVTFHRETAAPVAAYDQAVSNLKKLVKGTALDSGQ